MQKTDNYRKHTSNNPAQRLLINNFLKNLADTIERVKINRILDVGCGEGITLAYLKDRKIYGHLEGIDILKEAIFIGKKIHPDLTLKQGSVYKLPYKDNSFDLTICTEVLEHLERPEEALKEIKRVSKKYCVFSVPNEPFFILANFLRGKNLSRWGNDIEHIQHWSKGEFKNFLEWRGLKAINVKHPFPWTMILTAKNDK